MAKSKIKMPTETITDKNIKLVMSVLRRPKLSIIYLNLLAGPIWMLAKSSQESENITQYMPTEMAKAISMLPRKKQ